MGASLGELFVQLGFDIDDQKLKDFKENLRSTKDAAIGLGEVVAATTGALSLFVQHSADGAVRLNNMAQQFGVNTQAAQTFANALHIVNSQISIAAGQQEYSTFSQMISGQLPLGQGSATALLRLGGEYHPGTGQTSEDILQNLAKNYKAVYQSLGGNDAERKSIYSKYLADIGLPGSQAAIKQLSENPSAYNAASRYNDTPDMLEKLGEFARVTGELDDAFKKFYDTIASDLAGPMAEIAQKLINILNYLDDFNSKHPYVADAEGAAGAGLGVYGVVKLLKGAASLVGLGGAGAEAGAAGGFGAIPGAAILGGFASIPWVSSWAGTQIGEYLKERENNTFSDVQRQGILQALYDESGRNLNPNAYGQSKYGEQKGGPNEAYGIAQWHRDRIAALEKAGFKIHGGTREDQLAAVNYELTQGMERSAGDKIRQAHTQEEAYLLTKKYYERPAGSQNIIINLHSNATDNKKVADMVVQGLQSNYNTAKPQTNLAF